MGLFLAALAVLAAAVLWILSFRERQKANPDQKIPHFGSPPSTDGRAFVYLIIGGAMLGSALGFLLNQIPIWAGFLIGLTVVTPYTVLNYRHNRQIAQRSPTPQ